MAPGATAPVRGRRTWDAGRCDLSNKKPGTVAHYEALVADALRCVVEGLDEALDLEALAAPACMAPLHFHRVFRGLVGETPLQLHRRLRLERAAWRLAHRPGESVLRIALDAGYDTHESFTRAFREAFCRAPIEHRALANAAGGTSSPGTCATDTRGGTGPPVNRLQAACGLHADGPVVTWPVDAGTLFIHRGALTMNVEMVSGFRSFCWHVKEALRGSRAPARAAAGNPRRYRPSHSSAQAVGGATSAMRCSGPR